MKIISWNCNGKFSTKFPAVLEEDADIYVIQRCENPSESDSDAYREFASNHFWTGHNQEYGLGIFAKDDVKLELVDLDDKGFRYFLPVRVNDDFNLLAILNNPDVYDKPINYPKEIIRYYDEQNDSGFFNDEMIMCGDFGCDVGLVNEAHVENVYEMIETLSKLGLVDVYHDTTGEDYGEETKSTFFMDGDSFHIDNVFASHGRVKDLEIPDYESWMELSDHVPLIFEI